MKPNKEQSFERKAIMTCLIVSMCANFYAFVIMPRAAKSQSDVVEVKNLDPAYFYEERVLEYILPDEECDVEIVLTPKPSPTPAVAKQSAKASLPSIQYEGATVYVTKSGKKFHRESCGSLSKSKIPILYEEACSDGYTPCGKCKP